MARPAAKPVMPRARMRVENLRSTLEKESTEGTTILQKSRLLNLPPELRDLIYEFVVENAKEDFRDHFHITRVTYSHDLGQIQTMHRVVDHNIQLSMGDFVVGGVEPKRPHPPRRMIFRKREQDLSSHALKKYPEGEDDMFTFSLFNQFPHILPAPAPPALPLVCRQLYIETALLPLQTINLYSFEDPWTMRMALSTAPLRRPVEAVYVRFPLHRIVQSFSLGSIGFPRGMPSSLRIIAVPKNSTFFWSIEAFKRQTGGRIKVVVLDDLRKI